MALTAKFGKSKKENGDEVDAFFAEFTNGTLEQLDELALFLEKEGLDLPKNDPDRKLAVIKIGIAWLEGLKDRDKVK